jgi:hypothetical protein
MAEAANYYHLCSNNSQPISTTTYFLRHGVDDGDVGVLRAIRVLVDVTLVHKHIRAVRIL